MARRPLSRKQVEGRESAARSGGDPSAAARQFEQWAADAHPDDWLHPSDLLVRAAELWHVAGDSDRAVAAARRAAEIGEPELRSHLVYVLLRAGRRDDADAVAAEIERSAEGDIDAYDAVAQAYERAGCLDEAHRWFTMGVVRAEHTHHDALLTLLIGRAQVRRLLDLPPDEYDETVTAASAAIMRAVLTGDD